MSDEVGAYRHLITIEEATETNPAGEPVLTWGTYATAWASVVPMSGRELFRADAAQRYADVTHRMRMQYIAWVTPKMRVSWDSRVFRIRAVIDEEERTRKLVLYCTEDV